jgi:hypothetical protein
VEQEWRYALELYQGGRDEFIRPVYWTRNLHPIPKELDELRIHFERLDFAAIGWRPRRRLW